MKHIIERHSRTKPPDQIILQTHIGKHKKLGIHRRRRWGRPRKLGPVRLEFISTTTPLVDPPPPTLNFTRRKPKCTWVVPAVYIPLYWFDIVMIRRHLITAIPPDVFICDGHRFKVIAQEQKIIGRAGYTRWLVYKEDPTKPDGGHP